MTRFKATMAPSEPQSLEEIEDLKKEKLKSLSLDFELDLIRLSKTIRLISQSGKISKDHISYLENTLAEFQENLDKIVKSSLVLEEEIGRVSPIPVEINGELTGKLNTFIKEIRTLLDDHLDYSRKIKEDLEKKTKEYIDNLESTHKLHKQELKELYSRLTQQQNSLSNTFVELSVLDEKKSSLPQNPETKPPKERKPVEGSPPNAPRPGINPLQSPINSVLRHSEISYLIMLVIFVFLFFIFFNDGKESKNTKVSSKSETVYSWEISKGKTQREKELSGSRIQETKSANEEESIEEIKYETLETDSNKNEVEGETTIKEPPSEKQILALTVPAANLRKGPNKKYPAASVVKSGEAIEKLDESGNWIKIKTQSGDEGWLWKKLVREEVD